MPGFGHTGSPKLLRGEVEEGQGETVGLGDQEGVTELFAHFAAKNSTISGFCSNVASCNGVKPYSVLASMSTLCSRSIFTILMLPLDIAWWKAVFPLESIRFGSALWVSNTEAQSTLSRWVALIKGVQPSSSRMLMLELFSNNSVTTSGWLWAHA